MATRRRSADPAGRFRRLGVLGLVLAGFLTMHGFVAVVAAGPASASGDTHVLAAMAMPGQEQAQAAPGPAVTGSTSPSDGDHDPENHVSLLAGCVLAAVGVVGVAWAVTALRRGTALSDLATDRFVSILPVGLVPAVPRPDVRYRLCVLRV